MARGVVQSFRLLALLAALAGSARAGEVEIFGFDGAQGLRFQGATVSNFFTLEFAPALDGPWTNWGSVSAAAITGAVMGLPSPFFYRIVETPERTFPPYATGTPLYVESDAAALTALADFELGAAALYQPRGDYATGTPLYVESDPVATGLLAGYETAAHAAATYQPRGDYLTNGAEGVVFTNRRLGVASAQPAAPLQVGAASFPESQDYQVLVSRGVTNEAGRTNGHAFGDVSLINRAGGISYNSFDSRVALVGTNAYGHLAGFQNIPAFSSAGGIEAMYGFYSAPALSVGRVGASYGLFVGDPHAVGAALGANHGVYVAELTAGATNFAFYAAGNTPSHFGGVVRVGALALGTNAAVSNWPAAGARKAAATPASIVVAADHVPGAGVAAVGADTAAADLAITLPDRGADFESLLVRKFSAAHTLTIRRGTNVVATLSADGATRIYDWWPARTNWFERR